MIARLVRLFRREREEVMSAAWLEKHRASSQIDYEGVAIKWPIRKLTNESPMWNAQKLKQERRAVR
jgi:hypothetical protein